MKTLLAMLAVVALTTSVPVSAAPPDYYVDESKLPFSALPGLPSERQWGVLNGAGHRIEVPANWNGQLVLWAHGYRGTGLELTVDDHPLRPFLVANGYAWAASSYSRNDYDPTQGAKDTHALTQLFNGKFGNASRTYITGASMGGHVTALVAEVHGSYRINELADLPCACAVCRSHTAEVAVFLPVRSVGVQGDGRRYEWVVALRAVETVDFMSARWAHLPYEFLDKVTRRIVNETTGISRVVYDVTGKPPGTIEWE